MLTYQDFERLPDTDEARAEFVQKLIGERQGSEEMQIALDADAYFAQKNVTINRYAKKIFTLTGESVRDFTAADNRIASNFFHTFNVRRCAYSLGNGVEFGEKGTKEKLGLRFDTELKNAALYALIHGRSYLFWNADHVHVFKATEFAPLLDETTGAMRAGVRFWQLEADKPLNATLYETDGYTELRREKGEKMTVAAQKQAYKKTVRRAPADQTETVVGEKNYGGALPIVMMYGSMLHQSTLVGLRASIDAFDLIRSGFANDLQECAQIYWILENYNGMDDKDLVKFRDRLKLLHIASADTGDGGRVSAHTQDVPHAARTAFLEEIRAGMYEDFGLMDLKTLSAAATNDHIEAGYQPQDDMADDFEYQIIDCVQQLLALQGIEDTPRFKRGRIANAKEQVEMLVMEAGIVNLPDEVLVQKFPNFTPEEVKQALDLMADADVERYEHGSETQTDADGQDVTGDEV